MNRLIKEHEIYKGPVCRFTHNEVEFENGSTGYRDILHLPGAVAVLAVDKKQRILFVEQYRHAVNDKIIELPAGMLEKDEDHIKAALRELQEETGYKANKIEYLADFYTSPGLVNEKIYLYYAEDLEFIHQDLDSDEYLEVKRFTCEEVEKMIENNLIRDGKSIIAYLLYKNRKAPR